MKNAIIKKTLLLAVGAVFVWWAWKSPAQDTSAATTSLQMPYAVTQVLELEQAKVGDSTVIAYINSSGTSFNLTAAQIVFLRQQGVSDAVITAMLTQPRTSAPAASTPTVAPAPQYPPAPQYTSAPQYTAPPQYASATSTGDSADPTVITQPSVTYVQTAPPSYNYSYYYPYSTYAWYGWPFCWTWYGGGWHWGWHGASVGWHGGWGWHGTWGGGGWHGGSVGGWHGGSSGHGGFGGGFHGGGHR